MNERINDKAFENLKKSVLDEFKDFNNSLKGLKKDIVFKEEQVGQKVRSSFAIFFSCESVLKEPL